MAAAKWMDENLGFDGLPPAQGLYDPQFERDACGVGFVVNIHGNASHQIIEDAKSMVLKMQHRGATSSDNDSGDGSGILVAIPHAYYASVLRERYGDSLPPAGLYATGLVFTTTHAALKGEQDFTDLACRRGLKVICWRTVPVDNSCLGEVARSKEPYIRQVFVKSDVEDVAEFRRKILVLRKEATHSLHNHHCRFYICSLSTETIVYKGQLTPVQLWQYYKDLAEESFTSHLALVHSRFSTNTFPSWERAHPLRMLAHNGEINTLRGNKNLMSAREGVMRSQKFGDNLRRLYPVIESGCSDSGCVDNVLEFLCIAGERSLPEAAITMVPEAWQQNELMSEEKRAFYKWSSMVMEPWDGPALLTFTDGRYIGAILDRNGLRPSRFYLTDDDVMYMASEVGVCPRPPKHIVKKGRLRPGRMLLVDTQRKIFMRDDDVKHEIARLRPVRRWLQQKLVTMKDMYESYAQDGNVVNSHSNGEVEEMYKDVSSDRRLTMFGYTVEHINMLILPMIYNKKEALGSMGNDAPLECLSKYNPLVYDYFKQLFAQVTNPPIDPFRESIIMSLACPIGPEANILEPSEQQCDRLYLENPILSLQDMIILKNTAFRDWKTKTIDAIYEVSMGIRGLLPAIESVCRQAYGAAENGYKLVVLSDRNAGPRYLPIPSLLVTGAVHHYLIQQKRRMMVGLIVETAEAREIHHFCTLLGYGADAICPYLVLETVSHLRNMSILKKQYSDDEIFQRLRDACHVGISKVMAKMGIATLQSYKGAQIFEAVGLHTEVIDKCFRGSASRIGGVNFHVIADEIISIHAKAYSEKKGDTHVLVNPGFYHWRDGGESHINQPETVALLQEAVRSPDKDDTYEKYVERAYESIRSCTIRGQLDFIYSENALKLEEVEEAKSIVKRFVTGAMSFGSISAEAHTTLAIAMNKIGGKSNCGEGGEECGRYLNQTPDNNTRSAIKQVE